MLRCLFALLLLFDFSTAHAEDDEIVSPHKSFKIVQHREEEGVKQTIQFLKGPSRIVTLEYGISWPASYYVSPDEKRILRIQHSGSGDHVYWLYRVETANQRLWRMEEQLGA